MQIVEQRRVKLRAHTSLPTILVAEDNMVNTIFIKTAIERILSKKVEVITVVNGLDAINTFIKHGSISLVIMDVKMPIMSGIDASIKIKELAPDVPIIIQSAYVSPEDIKIAEDAGCEYFIPKPIDADRLISTIEMLI